MKPIHKFNNGKETTLCNNCYVIINENLTNTLFCDKCKGKTKFIISKNYYSLKIKAIEKKHNAKYVGDFCTKNNKTGNYNEKPCSIFYVENPDISKGHSNYFGIFTTSEIVNDKIIITGIYITNGSSAFEEPLQGLFIKKDNVVLISCFNHDYVTHNEHMIDGGRTFLRYTIEHNTQLVNVKVNKTKFEII